MIHYQGVVIVSTKSFVDHVVNETCDGRAVHGGWSVTPCTAVDYGIGGQVIPNKRPICDAFSSRTLPTAPLTANYALVCTCDVIQVRTSQKPAEPRTIVAVRIEIWQTSVRLL